MAREVITESEALERFDEMLDEVYGMAKIAGFEYRTSRALRECDPVAYRCGFNDWVDGEMADDIFEVEGW